jgi:hypothetical protein
MDFTKDELELLAKKPAELNELDKTLRARLKAREYMKRYRSKTEKPAKPTKTVETVVKKINETPTVKPQWYNNLLKDHPKFKINSEIYIQYRAYDEKQITGLLKLLNEVLVKVFEINITDNTKSIITSIYRGKNVEVGRFKTNLDNFKKELKILNSYSITDSINKIKDYYKNINTIKTKLRAIVNLLARIDGYEKSYQIITNFNISLNTEYVKDRETNQDSDEEIEKLQHIMEIYNPDNLENTNKLIDESDLNSKEKLIAGLYLLQPPRRLEYRLVKLITDDYSIEKLSNNLNYLVIKNDEPIEFIFKRYKTSQKGGKLKREVFGTQQYKINEYIKIYLQNYILDNGVKINEMLFNIPLSTFGKLVETVMNKLFLYDKITSTTIRKISAIYNQQDATKSIKDKKALATAMAHSYTENTLYNKIVKKD